MRIMRRYYKFVGFVGLFILASLPARAQDGVLAVENGVSWELAQYRARVISDLNYKLDVSIPMKTGAPVQASSEISFILSENTQDLQIDFKERSDNLRVLRVNGDRKSINHYNEHIVIDRNDLRLGNNKISIEYIAGNGALNRTPAYVYTLFVPDRMRTSFPSFDQPNLKATFELSMTMPKGWEAMSAGEVRSRSERIGRTKIHFRKSDLMSTYLFSFVAGNFEKVTKKIGGVQMTMMHREPDSKRAKRNMDEIFLQHKKALDYLEEYTGIKQPFKKFGFALIPSFQFGGMEHVGAISYKSEILMLDENPSPAERLLRAALISHETAHMWFGDLVTMDWFNDVWTKEVFANFMADKVVHPTFPEINHDLRAHLGRHPSAYRVDRTAGANPIRQNLPNLDEAGTMYGDIIYDKSPIMMQQLELLLGEENFRDGIREYLNTYAFDNATWPDLIDILDKRSSLDLKTWSEVWVNTPGRPVFSIKNEPGEGLLLSQMDPMGMGRSWAQSFDVKRGAVPYSVSIEDKAINLNNLGNNSDPTILPNSNGIGYGLFPIEKNFIQDYWDSLNDLERAAAFINLYEHLLENNGTINPNEYMDLLLFAVEAEKNPLILDHLLEQLIPIYWTMIGTEDRLRYAPQVEELLWKQVNNDAHDVGTRRLFFRNYANVAITDDALSNVMGVWDKSLDYDHLKFGIRDYTNFAGILAIKLPQESQQIIARQSDRVEGLDSQRRFDFIKPALSPDESIRDRVFESLLSPNARHTEDWVLTILDYLHHPLRRNSSEKYLRRTLDELKEIQETGDIFFPGRWLNRSFKYYNTETAAQTVRDFLDQNPDYNYQLKLKILQETDPLLRASSILNSTD